MGHTRRFRKLITIVLSATVTVPLLPAAARAQPPVENPRRTPGLVVPKAPLKPKLLSIAVARLGKTTPACVKPGVDYRLTGERLTSTTSPARGVSVGGHGSHVVLRAVDWTDTNVTVRFPQNGFANLDHTKSYYMAVTDNGWASDLLFRVQPCAPGV